MSAATRNKMKTKSFFASTSKRIRYWLEHHPVASNSILCLNLWVVGDCLAQYFEHELVVADELFPEERNSGKTPSVCGLESKTTPDGGPSSSVSSFWRDHLDRSRTMQCAGYGAVVTGPLIALWYPFLDRLCSRHKIALKYGLWAAPLAKVAADELIMEPPTLVLFFGYMNACEGGNLQDFKTKVETQFFPSWFTSMAVWPIVLLGTFRFLSVPVQAPVINVCCVVWDAFLSHRNALAKHRKKETADKP